MTIVQEMHEKLAGRQTYVIKNVTLTQFSATEKNDIFRGSPSASYHQLTNPEPTDMLTTNDDLN